MVYSNIENLVFLAKSEVIRTITNVMEYWNNGMLEYWFRQNDICIPIFHHPIGYLTANTTPRGEIKA